MVGWLGHLSPPLFKIKYHTTNNNNTTTKQEQKQEKKGRKIRREQRRTTGKHQFLLYYRELEAHRVFLLFHHIMNYHNTMPLILISTRPTSEPLSK